MRVKTETILFTLKLLSEMTFRKKKKLLMIWGTRSRSPSTTTFAVKQSIVAQPHHSYKRRSPDIEALPYQRKGSTSAGHWVEIRMVTRCS